MKHYKFYIYNAIWLFLFYKTHTPLAHFSVPTILYSYFLFLLAFLSQYICLILYLLFPCPQGAFDGVGLGNSSGYSESSYSMGRWALAICSTFGILFWAFIITPSCLSCSCIFLRYQVLAVPMCRCWG